MATLVGVYAFGSKLFTNEKPKVASGTTPSVYPIFSGLLLLVSLVVLSLYLTSDCKPTQQDTTNRVHSEKGKVPLRSESDAARCEPGRHGDVCDREKNVVSTQGEPAAPQVPPATSESSVGIDSTLNDDGESKHAARANNCRSVVSIASSRCPDFSERSGPQAKMVEHCRSAGKSTTSILT